jgi:hypothetical protein
VPSASSSSIMTASECFIRDCLPLRIPSNKMTGTCSLDMELGLYVWRVVVVVVPDKHILPGLVY